MDTDSKTEQLSAARQGWSREVWVYVGEASYLNHDPLGPSPALVCSPTSLESTASLRTPSRNQKGLSRGGMKNLLGIRAQPGCQSLRKLDILTALGDGGRVLN